MYCMSVCTHVQRAFYSSLALVQTVPETVGGVDLAGLMKLRSPDDRGTLGIRIAMSLVDTDLAPTQIQTVVPGSLAHASGTKMKLFLLC